MLAIPTVHLNGTSPKELQEQIRAAIDALHLAVEAMRNAAPHARDYYPQGDDVYNVAATQHYNRINKIEEVIQEYVDIYAELD